MTKSARTLVRAFDGSLADAEGLLQVERATFNESPYGAKDVCDMLAGGFQQAWLAIVGDSVAGFVIAFPTHGLSGGWWDIDLLAVHPDWAGRGLAARLIRTAAAHCIGTARRARAAVATDNAASARAFTRTGFREARDVCNLLIYRTQGLSSRSWVAPGVTLREATRLADAEEWLVTFPIQGVDPLLPGGLQGSSSAGLGRGPAQARTGSEEQAVGHQAAQEYPNRTFLLAEQDGQPAGYAELIQVQTLLYRGEWIESFVASTRTIREALIEFAVNRAKTADLDEVGAMVPGHNWLLRQALLAGGFRSLGEFRWLTAELPLPGWAAFPLPSQPAGGGSDGGHV
jgi:GNAT superfamily N-acetyltransferase